MKKLTLQLGHLERGVIKEALGDYCAKLRRKIDKIQSQSDPDESYIEWLEELKAVATETALRLD